MTRSIDDAFINAYRPDDDGDNLTPNTGRIYRPRRVTLKQGFLASVLGRQDWYIDDAPASPPGGSDPRQPSTAASPAPDAAPAYAWYEEPEIVASMPAVQVLFHDLLTTDAPADSDGVAAEAQSEAEQLTSAPRRTAAASKTARDRESIHAFRPTLGAAASQSRPPQPAKPVAHPGAATPPPAGGEAERTSAEETPAAVAHAAPAKPSIAPRVDAAEANPNAAGESSAESPTDKTKHQTAQSVHHEAHTEQAQAEQAPTEQLQAEQLQAEQVQAEQVQAEPAHTEPAPIEQVQAEQVPADVEQPGPSEEELAAELDQVEETTAPEIYRIDDASPTPPPPFHAEWEVDCFHWPAVCRNLEKLRAEALQEAGDQLTAAASDGLATLMVTSACRGEGRSTMALCIAKAAAESGSRVAIVDADLDHPQLAEYLNVRLQQDWRQSVFEGGRLEDAAIMSIDDRLTLVPLMRNYRGIGQSLSDARVAKMLGRLAGEFDLVIIDAGPIGLAERLLHPSSDAVDAVIVVRDQRSTTEEEVQRCVMAIRDRGVQAVGIAENFGGRPVAAS